MIVVLATKQIVPRAIAVSVERMRRHVLDLSIAHAIQVSWCVRPSKAYAVKESREICIAPIRSAISYATALHEIGHVCGQHQASPHSLIREAAAWRWARANALTWNYGMEKLAGEAIGFAKAAVTELARLAQTHNPTPS